MYRAGTVIALLVSLVVTAVPCAGWNQSAEDRRDCCEHGQCPADMHQDAASGVTQTSADNCCAASEHRQQQHQSQSPESTMAIAIAPFTRVTSSLVPIALEHSTPVRVTAAARSASLHVLFSVFLV